MLTLKIIHDEYAENPRHDRDHLGTIVAWHKNYRFDENPKESPNEWLHDRPSSKYITLPVYLLDHSGLSIRTYPFNDPWDSGQLGYITMSKETARSNWKWRPYVHARAHLIAEIEELDDYYIGNVWGYQISDESDRLLDSCWGFIGSEADCRREGEAALKALQSADNLSQALIRETEVNS